MAKSEMIAELLDLHCDFETGDAYEVYYTLMESDAGILRLVEQRGDDVPRILWKGSLAQLAELVRKAKRRGT